jgi:predicted transposase YdaD
MIADRLVLATDIAEARGKKLGKKLGKKQGVKLGKKLGKKQGKKQAKIEYALGMLRENIPVEIIARITRLPTARILSLTAQGNSEQN